MGALRYKVYVVVDRNFGAQLETFERGVPVWIVDSPDNKPVVQRLWRERPAKSHLDGITIFADSSGMPAEEILLSQLGTIDLHHGIHSADSPHSELEIFGAKLTPKLKTELMTFGFDDFRESEAGFIAKRPEPSKLQEERA
jgi:hypothetical protein